MFLTFPFLNPPAAVRPRPVKGLLPSRAKFAKFAESLRGTSRGTFSPSTSPKSTPPNPRQVRKIRLAIKLRCYSQSLQNLAVEHFRGTFCLKPVPPNLRKVRKVRKVPRLTPTSPHQRENCKNPSPVFNIVSATHSKPTIFVVSRFIVSTLPSAPPNLAYPAPMAHLPEFPSASVLSVPSVLPVLSGAGSGHR